MSNKRINLRDETDELLSRMSVRLYGFDTTKLNWREQQAAEEAAHRRWELEEELRRRNPQPEPILSEAEHLEKLRVELLTAKLQKVSSKPLRDTTDEELKEQLKILRSIVEGGV
ncbi:hypothetical protein AB1K89_03455 [Sporosarcina sp. 179-K 8C2 HS]|uniref:hypothetical protein n=1 Tax=Sporosarcina sp. 179-K 8C2 HS TaxID=3142387 RepID=UPI0039A30C93